MPQVSGEFKSFRVSNGISLILSANDTERRLHLRSQDNAALYEFLDRLLREGEEGRG